MLMKGRLTINNSVCGRWLLSLFTMLLVSVAMQAEDYGLTVGGVQVTSDNAANITGTNITAGTVSFNPQTSTLTLNGATINGTISSSIADLKVKLVGVSVFNVAMDVNSCTYVFNYTGSGNDASPSLTFSADNLGATLLAYGDQENNKLELVSGYTVSYNPDVSSWINTYRRDTGTDDKPFIRLSKPYPITIAGESVDDSNKDNVMGDDLSEEGSVARVSFNATTNTLTLNKASISAYNNEAIVSGLDNLTIFLVGESGIYGANGFTFNKTSAVEEVTVTFTTNAESSGSLFIQNLETKLFGEGVTPVYTNNVSIKHNGDSHTIGCLLGISVGGVPVTQFNKGNVLGDGKVSYNPGTYTLTLNNATIEPEEETSGIVHSNAENLKIALIGNNSIQGGAGCSAISHYGGVETYSLSFAKGDPAQHFSLTLIGQNENNLIDGFDTNYGDFFVFDNEDDGTYTSTISSSVFGGTGSADEPFLIKTADDLKLFTSYYNTGYFNRNSHVQLHNDINCENQTGFTTIAENSDATFCGVFDGNHKTISNLTMTGRGLFGYVEKDGDYVGTIKDLTLSNYHLTGESGVPATGGLVSELSDGAIVSNCTIVNSTIACYENQYNPEVGGIVARSYNSTVSNCIVDNTIVNATTSYPLESGPQAFAAGIVASNTKGTISNCQVINGSKIMNFNAEGCPLTTGAIVAYTSEGKFTSNTYSYDVKVETGVVTNTESKVTKSGYTHRGTNEETDPAGISLYTQKITLPAGTSQATVTGKQGTYYSTVDDGILVAPGQTATLNVTPGEGYAIASLTATNTTTSEEITTTATAMSGNVTQYTFTMPDAPVTVVVATVAAYGISVAGVEVTELNYTDVLGDGKVSFVLPVQSLETPAESTPATLTLNGATINGSIVSSLGDGLTIHLVGSNVIDANNSYAFVSTITTSYKPLKFTTPDANAGQLLIKNTASQYYSRFSPSFNNGLTFDDADSQWLIGAAPKMTPGEGLYWPNQQYTVSGTTGGTLYYKNNLNSTEQAYVQPFTLTTGKHNLSAMKQIEINDATFKLYGQGNLYIVHNKPGFSKEAGSYTGAQTVKLTNLPTLPEDPAYYPQVWYYLNNSKNDSIQYTSANQTIAVNESTRVSVYIIDEDSGKVVKSAAVTAQYTIRQDPALRFYTSENSYMSTGSTENISYDDEYTSPVLKGKINGEYTAELTALGITYSSSDETVATIDQTGKITIVGGGYATITATSQQTDIYSASTTNFILKVRPADPNVSLEEGAYYTGKKLTMVRIGENGTMYYSYGYKDESERTVYPEGGISLPKGCYDFYPYTRCGTNEQNIWSYGNAHRMMYVYDQPTISKDAGTYDGEIEVEITNLPESGSYNADVYYYFDDDEDHAVQYTSGSKITVNESKTLNVYIYVEGDSSKNYKTDVIKRQYVIRQDAGLAYTQNNEPVEVAEYTIGGENNEDLPELVNENGVAVTYSSEDENVATVNAQGKVTIVGIGETTITATSAQTATLQAGEAAYTLRVYKDLNYESITVTVADATYTGEAVEPEVTVKDGTTDITELMIISYDNNVEVGNNATVTIVPNDDLEVNFYVGSRTKTFSIVTRTLEIGKDVNFASGQKWASFYTTTEDLLLPEGVMAYIVTAVGNDVATVKAINYVPKNVPVLIEKESTTMTDNTSAEGNLLQGTAESTAVSGIEGNVYVLYNGGFTRTTTGAIPARRAYLVLEQAAGARLSIVEGEATDITSVGYDSVATDGSTYDMQGRKVESLSKKGLYIKNGRKVVIK